MTSVYIDTCTFIDFLTQRKPEYMDSLDNFFGDINNGTIEGYTSNLTLIEVAGFFKGRGKTKEEIFDVIEGIKSYPNLNVVLIEGDWLKDLEQKVIDVCTEPRDTIHLVVAEYSEVDALITSDKGFQNTATKIIPAYLPNMYDKFCEDFSI